MLLGFAAWIVFLFVVNLPTAAKPVGDVVFNIFASLFVSAALALLYRGSLHVASLVYLCGSWLAFTFLIVLNGGIHSVGVVYYVAVTISAAWLLGYQAALWSAAVCLGSSLMMAILELNGIHLPLYFPGTPLGIWNSLVGAMIISAVPVARVMQILKEALAQSRQAEAELRQHREHLEELVQQRTAELVEARDQAQAANRAKTVFLANMSHELRTPLNAILGFSNLLRESGASKQQCHDLDIINRSGEHLLGLINDVLDVAKIEAGRSELEIAPCDLGKLVADVTDMIRPRASQKGLTLRVENPQLPLFIRTDAARLRQVLINLLNNAVKFTNRGSITLRVNAMPANDTGEVLLTFQIEDTGEGIAAGDQAAIFDAFVQTSAAKRHDGAGLGLTISRQIIELMGGTIQVESTPGQGSRFRVEIKAERAPEPEINRGLDLEHVIALAAGQPEYRVLIVEDQQENWMVLERLLENAGFRVRVAENGAQGVEEFREWRPQFIWMDLRIPVMDGIEATRRIRACEGGRDVKIVAVTASAYASERSEILAEGLDDYVRKPYRPAEIFDCIARHLGVFYQVSQAAAKSVGEGAGELLAEDLSSLPDELRKELRDALITLEPARISAAIERISQENTALGLILARRAGSYAYSAIFEATGAQA
jgi:signal transduction histidine kinase/CheY-like chemotaxis protein